MLDDRAPRIDVEADRRLVEHQQPRLDAAGRGPARRAGACRRTACAPARRRGPPAPRRSSSSSIRAPARRPAKALQAGRIAQVLLHAEVEIEGRPLEHDADRGQRRAARAAQIVAGDGDAAAAAANSRVTSDISVVLPAPLGPSRAGEAAGRHAKADVVQRPAAAAVGEATRLRPRRASAGAAGAAQSGASAGASRAPSVVLREQAARKRLDRALVAPLGLAQRHRDVADHRAGRCRQQPSDGGQHRRLVEVVGDEQVAAVRCSASRSSSSRRSRPAVASSSETKGSSSSSRPGSTTKARASATRRAMPSDSREAKAWPASPRPTSRQHGAHPRRRRSSVRTRRRLSSTVRQGSRRGSWKT